MVARDLWLGVGRVEGGVNGTQGIETTLLYTTVLTNALITLSKLTEYKIQDNVNYEL